jgi:hypothetical protein
MVFVGFCFFQPFVHLSDDDFSSQIKMSLDDFFKLHWRCFELTYDCMLYCCYSYRLVVCSILDVKRLRKKRKVSHFCFLFFSSLPSFSCLPSLLSFLLSVLSTFYLIISSRGSSCTFIPRFVEIGFRYEDESQDRDENL